MKKKITPFIALMVMTLCLSALASGLQITNDSALVIDQQITLAVNDEAAQPVWEITRGEELALLDGNLLTVLGQGEITVSAQAGDDKTEKTFTAVPYERVAGYSVGEYPGPVAVWVDFNDQVITNINVVGSGHPVILEAYGEEFSKEAAQASELEGKTCEEIADLEGGSVVAAVKDACLRHTEGLEMTIRYYQSLMTGRYLANFPYVANQEDDVIVESAVAASYPQDAAKLVMEDVLNNGEVRWADGVVVNKVSVGDKTYTNSHNAVLAVEPGIVVISYTLNGKSVLDALEIYENFTLDPDVTSVGRDAYGKVVNTTVKDDTVVYRVLGDKAMNSPGGTCGSTVIDVTVDIPSRTIFSAKIAAHSDSTYLSSGWEYGGGFVEAGDALFDINVFMNKLTGLSADEVINPYALSAKEVVGGTIVEGGVDMIMTGATRTPNAIIYALNEAIEQFQSDYPS